MKMATELLMDADVDVLCNAGWGERSEDRENSLNGHRTRLKGASTGFSVGTEGSAHGARSCAAASRLRVLGLRGAASQYA